MTRVVLTKGKVVHAGRRPAAETPTDRKRAGGKTPETSLPSGADLPRHVARLEGEMKDLKKMFGLQDMKMASEGVCPEDGLAGEVTRTDEFSGRKYVHFQDKAGHSWFDEVLPEQARQT